MAALDDQIRAVLAADNPQSVRHVFYRLTDPTGPVSVPKTERGYDAIVRRCTALRRSGRSAAGPGAGVRGYDVRSGLFFAVFIASRRFR